MRFATAAALTLLLLTPSAALTQASAMSDAFGINLATRQNPGGSGVKPSTVALAGAGWVRISADWAALEPARGRFVWTDLDPEIHRAADAGVRALVMFEKTPRWAALTPDAPPLVWSHQPPRQLADWTAFVKTVVSRYHGRVAAWQIEPSLDLSVYRGTGADYRQMLHAARLIVRSADPRALVVAASPGGLDLPYIKTLARSGDDFDAIMLYPRGRTPEDLLEALTVIRSRIVTDAHHQLWLNALPDWGAQTQMAAAALAGGVTREFWPHLDLSLTTTVRFLGAARFVGPLYRGPGAYALVFTTGASHVAVAWSTGSTRSIRLATTGAPAVVDPTGQPVPPTSALTSTGPSAGDGAVVPIGPNPVFITNLAPSAVDEANRTAQQAPLQVPREASQDFSHAESVSATLGTTNAEHGLYNQRLRTLPSGAVVPVVVDGVEAVRTDQPKDAVYVYFDVDHSYVYYVDGRYDLLITVEVHRASVPERVGFNLFYDSMSGYRFTPWQWVDAGQGWATYKFRITDASFSSTWGWAFAVNGAGDKKEDLIVRSASVKKLSPGSGAP